MKKITDLSNYRKKNVDKRNKKAIRLHINAGETRDSDSYTRTRDNPPEK